MLTFRKRFGGVGGGGRTRRFPLHLLTAGLLGGRCRLSGSLTLLSPALLALARAQKQAADSAMAVTIIDISYAFFLPLFMLFI